ncbi:hypothetical protein [Candidatus Palauibacter sp.]|uniref:hypothetical protein n=1 Tax=Candidatus Palauibacter sp. TaxID=3101350 RepID=UPI003B01B165
MGDKKLRSKLARTTQGCRERELHRLYTSYGFEKKEGGRHTIFKHPSYPHLIGIVARHRHLHRFYVTDALKLLALLDTLEGEEEQC